MIRRPMDGLIVLFAIGTLATVVASFLTTQMELLKEGQGTWHLRVAEAHLALAPIAVLLFAGGVQALVRKQWALAAAGLPALPAWSFILLFVHNRIAEDIWIALVLLKMQGVQPFGAP